MVAVPNPCQGKTYIVKVNDGGPAVHYENGEKPPDEELGWVKEQFRSLGKEDSFESMLDGKTVKVGEKLDVSLDAAAELLDVKSAGLKIEKFNLTLKAAKPHAVFDADIQMSQTLNGPKMTINMTGQVVINPGNCWPVTVDIKGPLKLSGEQVQEGKRIDIKGAGTMSAKMSYGYGL